MGLRTLLRRPEVMGIVGLVVVDQLTKAMVTSSLRLHETIEVIPGLLNLTYVRNTGAAFGVLNGVDFPFKPLMVTLLALAALAAIGAYAIHVGSDTWIGRFGLTCVLGGAIGNLIDRGTRGSVVDFVDFYWGSFHFWAFNVADAAITVGAIALIIEMLAAGRHVPEAV